MINNGTNEIDSKMFSWPYTGVPKVMVIFTDGAPDSIPDAILAAERAKKSNIAIFTVGIGRDIKQEVLQQLASRKSYVMSATSYESLIEFVNKINSKTCTVSQTTKTGEKVDDQLNKNEKRFYIFSLPEEGIMLKIKTSVGKTQGIAAIYSKCIL
ncbi:MAG: VWA domain-containing protein [Sphingobacteriaceae bacterium]|nr:MAG: VWA domain-containing protein [Sphingobacteriaceae bacterium]